MAALRETFEECGLWLARGPVDAPALAQAQAAHAAQESFGAVVGSSGLALEPDALSPLEALQRLYDLRAQARARASSSANTGGANLSLYW